MGRFAPILFILKLEVISFGRALPVPVLIKTLFNFLCLCY